MLPNELFSLVRFTSNVPVMPHLDDVTGAVQLVAVHVLADVFVAPAPSAADPGQPVKVRLQVRAQVRTQPDDPASTVRQFVCRLKNWPGIEPMSCTQQYRLLF